MEGELNPQQMYDELRRLKKENEDLRRQRDILKKAMSILADTPPVGMRR